MSALNARFKKVADAICNQKLTKFKEVLSNVSHDPKKLLEMPDLVSYIYRNIINSPGAEKFDLEGLEKAVKIQITECVARHDKLQDFLEAMQLNEAANELSKIVELGVHDSIGVERIQFCLDSDTLRVINSTFGYHLDHINFSGDYISSLNATTCFGI